MLWKRHNYEILLKSAAKGSYIRSSVMLRTHKGKDFSMKAKVNEELCTGCGPCEETCPEVFKIDGDVATVTVEQVPAEVEETCREAMENCPTEAITIEE
jgi:ferredoxin